MSIKDVRGRAKRRSWALALALLASVAMAVVAACGTSNSSANDAGNGSCVPGQQTNCGCPGDTIGVQVCPGDGSRYGTCDCGMDGGLLDATNDSGSEGAAENGISDAPADMSGGDSSESGESGSDGGCALDAGLSDSGPPGNLNWAENFGTTGYIVATNVAIDPSSGDVVVVGLFYEGSTQATVNFGGGLLTSHCNADAGTSCGDSFVARFDKTGSYKWAKSFGNGLLVGANGLAVDGSGHVVVGGIFYGSTIDLGGGPLTGVGNDNLFLVEFDAGGTYVWGKSFGTAGQYEEIDAVAVDSTGHVLITGDCTSLDFGGGPLTGYYIAKFDKTGAHSWSKSFTYLCDTSSPTLAVDASGNVILAGCFGQAGSGTVDFGGGTLTTNSVAAFVAKFDSAGTYQWAKNYNPIVDGSSSSSDVSGGGLALDACGNIFVGGSFFGTIDFGTGPLTGSDSTKNYAFLAKIDPAGNGIWSKEFVESNMSYPPGELYPQSVAVDGAGGVTISAGLCGSVDYGGGPMTGTGGVVGCPGASMSIASFDSAGHFRWDYVPGPTSTASSTGTAFPQAIAATASSVVVVGGFGTCSSTCAHSPPGTTIVFPGKTLTATSAFDMFIADFAP